MTPSAVVVVILVCCAMVCITLIIIAKILSRTMERSMKFMDKDFPDLESFRHNWQRGRGPRD